MTAVPNVPLTSMIKLVAGGFRLRKTSKAQTESGQIRAIYSRSDISTTSTIDKFFDSNGNERNFIR